MNQKILKNRLLLKRLEIKIAEAVWWNFGYCPRGELFDKMLEDRHKLADIAHKEDFEWWKIWDECAASDSVSAAKALKTF